MPASTEHPFVTSKNEVIHKNAFSGKLNVLIHSVIELKRITQAQILNMHCIASVTDAENEDICSGLSVFSLIFLSFLSLYVINKKFTSLKRYVCKAFRIHPLLEPLRGRSTLKT